MQSRPLTIDVIPTSDFVTTDGVMKGETISFADELVLDDVYQIRPKTQHRLLSLVPDQDAGRLDDISGHRLHLDCCLTFMDASGEPMKRSSLLPRTTAPRQTSLSCHWGSRTTYRLPACRHRPTYGHTAVCRSCDGILCKRDPHFAARWPYVSYRGPAAGR